MIWPVGVVRSFYGGGRGARGGWLVLWDRSVGRVDGVCMCANVYVRLHVCLVEGSAGHICPAHLSRVSQHEMK